MHTSLANMEVMIQAVEKNRSPMCYLLVVEVVVVESIVSSRTVGLVRPIHLELMWSTP